MFFVRGSKSVVIAALLLAVLVGSLLWTRLRPSHQPVGFALGNGRLEATEVDVATKVPGRLLELLPREGDGVGKGQIVARLDAEDLVAQLRAAEAGIRQAQAAERQARDGVRASRSQADLAEIILKRSEELKNKGFTTSDKLDRDRSAWDSSQAALAAAAGRVREATAATEGATEKAASLRSMVTDTVLKAPIAGRVLYRLAEPGEVLGAGGKALTLLDLSDVFMSVFLPAAEVARVPLGAEARIVLDGMTEQPLPAKVSFVSPQAQFTPKEVETRSEREKLMFRVKVRVDSEWLAAHPELAKPGMPGVAYIRLDPRQPWPASFPAQ